MSIEFLGYNFPVMLNWSRSRLPVALLLSGLLAATITLFEPAKSAVSNWSEISIGFSELLARLAVPFLIAFVGIAAFAVFLMAVAPRRAIPMLVALYVALWAQGNVFVWEYGSFDASPIDWSEHSGKGLLEIAFWVATLALAFTKHEWVRRRALPIAAIVFALELAALAGQVRQNTPDPEPSGSQTSVVHAEGVTDLSLIRSVNLFSQDLNVIIIVLDALQSDFFSEAMRDPELRAAMPPGFTYFRNAVSLYALTEYSLQSMLTSKAVPDNVHLRKWRDTQVPGTLPARLTERGFDAVLTTFSDAHYRDFGQWGYRRVLSATLAESGSASSAWREDVSDLFALGLFRLSPHILKPRIYNNGRWQTGRLYPPRGATSQDPRIQYETRTDLAAFDALIASASSPDTTPRFRFLHFYGTHRPYTVDESCRYPGDSSISRKHVIAMTHCILSQLFEFLHKLDEIGVYDQSLIFVVADHGEKYVRLDVSAASPGLPDSGAPHSAANHRDAMSIDHPWRGVPLFLAKPLGNRHSLRISDVPVSLCDIPKSIFDALSIENDFECESIFSEGRQRQAPRMHYRYPNVAERRALDSKGLIFEKFMVVGHSWLPESWIPFDADAE